MARLVLMMQLLTCCWTQQAPVPPTSVESLFAEIAERAQPPQPAQNCSWGLHEAPKTFYVPQWCAKKSEVMTLHVGKFLPAGGFARVAKPAGALFILTAGFFTQVTRRVRLCRQQLVQGLPFVEDKWLDYAGLQRLGARHPWTHATDFLPLTYSLGTAGACAEWIADVKAGYARAPRAPPDRGAPAWVLKPPRGHLGRSIAFLPWDFAQRGNASRLCEQHRGSVAQQMVRSTALFRGGSVFSLRVHLLLASLAPMKAVWQRERAAYQFFAERPGPAARTNEGRYVTNQHARARARGSKNLDGPGLEAYTAVAATEFDRLRAGLWGGCIAPQLKVALAAYALHLLLALPSRAAGLFNLFGCDFLVEDSLRVRFLECNKWPAYVPVFGDLFSDVYPFVLRDAARRAGHAGGVPRALQDKFEVLLDEATGYVFTSPEPRARCSALHPGLDRSQ